MSFQDLEAGQSLASRQNLNNGKQDATQAVASGIFQINTAVSTFQRLVNTLGTPKDTPELREKLWVFAHFICLDRCCNWSPDINLTVMWFWIKVHNIVGLILFYFFNLYSIFFNWERQIMHLVVFNLTFRLESSASFHFRFDECQNYLSIHLSWY